MKIAFLHIGDMHLKNRYGVNSFHIKKIADTINLLPDTNHIVLVVAGDISFCGEAAQYKCAGTLLGKLIRRIKDVKPSTRITVVCVPGNHDVNHDGSPLTSKELQDIHRKGLYDTHLATELMKQDSFFGFANFNKCFETKSVFCQKLLDFSGFVIEFNLINSAVFSILEEDKGLHYIPQGQISNISTPTGADFVVTVMHHSPDWYIDEQKNSLEEVIYGKSSIVFLGHEHFLRKKSIQIESFAPAFIQAGGCLCQNEDWTTSAFHVGILDTDTLEYSDTEYLWNNSQNQYEQKEQQSLFLPKKPSIEKRPQMTDAYQKGLYIDSKHDICDDFSYYFVFPRIQSDERIGTSHREFDNEQAFIEEVLSKKRVLITGPYNSGKTILLKKLFSHLSGEGYMVLLCDIEIIRGKNPERIIRNCFEEIYGSCPSDFTRFEQLPKSQKVLIIDDVDQIQQKSFDKFMSYIDELFGTIIFSSVQTLDMSLVDRMKALLKAVDSVSRYEILPLFADKREELIRKTVSVLIQDQVQQEKTIRLLVETINAQRRFILLDPDFIIKYVECYCNNVGDVSSGESGVFSKVFEASLVNSISKHQTDHLSIDKAFSILSKVAHFIHFNKAYPITSDQVKRIIHQYNEDYGEKVDSIAFLSLATESKILIYDSYSDSFRFVNKNYLAYFVAKEIIYQYNLTGDDTSLQSILRFACFGINADILLFVSYLTDNIRILRLILSIANDYTSSWQEFDFDNSLPQFLLEERTHHVLLPAQNTREVNLDAEVDAERDADKIIKTVDIYDYSDEDVDNFLNQILRSVSLLIVVARCLPNFEHNLLKTDKEQFVKALYSIPNKIFGLWATEANKEVENIIRYFRDQSQEYYVRQKKASDEDIIRALQWAAMSLLLELYDFPVYYATKPNTLGYLSDFDYLAKSTYELEHLMMLERQGPPSVFISELFRLEKEKRGMLYNTLLGRIASYALVYNPSLDRSQIQKIQAKFFPNSGDQKRMMVQRLQASKED